MATNIPPFGPLAYLGQVSVPYIIQPDDPESNNTSFSVPTIWVNKTDKRAWILLEKPQNVANWVLFATSSGSIHDIITPTGGPVTPTLGELVFDNGIDMNIVGADPMGMTPNVVTFNAGYQDTLTTVSGFFTTITTIPVAAGQSVVLEGRMIASNVGHTDITGGPVMAVADGTAAALIGSPVINVEATSTGTFQVIFSGADLLIQVQAPSSAAYSWSFTYKYTYL